MVIRIFNNYPDIIRDVFKMFTISQPVVVIVRLLITLILQTVLSLLRSLMQYEINDHHTGRTHFDIFITTFEVI